MTKPKAKPAPTFKERVAPIKAAAEANAPRTAKPAPQPGPFYYLSRHGRIPEPISIPAGRYFFSADWLPDDATLISLQIRTPETDWKDVDWGPTSGKDADLGFHRNLDLPACHVRLVVPPTTPLWFQATLS